MATLEQLTAALVKADAAGNAADAKALADEIRRVRVAPEPTSLALQPSVRTDAGIPGPRQDLTMGQQVYQAARPYVAPLVEAGGAIGGGLLGGTAGTFGAGPVGTVAGGVAGAGLGYGIAKEGLEAADVAMGMKAPRQGAAQVVEPVRNILEGATFEAGGKVLGQALGYVGGKIADLRQIPLQKASKIVKDALGPDLEQVTNALRAAQGKGVSAAQATADINSPTFQALIERATARDPRFLRALEKTQGEESVNALAKLAGGSTAAAARGTTENAKNALNTVQGPAREAALNRANLGKAVAEYEAQAGKLGEEAAAKVADVRRLIDAGKIAEASARLDLIKAGKPVGLTQYTYKGELGKMADDWASKAADASLDLGQGARFAQGAADSMRSVGIKPLEGDKIVGSIRAVANNPEFAGNDVLLGAVKNVADDVAKWTSGGGVIDARALDAIRKNSVNAVAKQLHPNDPKAQKELAAKVLESVRPSIVKAVEDAGGTGYGAYLDAYATGLKAVSEKKMSAKALEMYQSDPKAFVKLVEGNSPKEIEKVFGAGNYDILKQMSAKAMETLKGVAGEVKRDIKVGEQAAAGQQALRELLDANKSRFRFPNFAFNRTTTAANVTLDTLSEKLGKNVMDKLTRASQSGQDMARLIDTLPAVERSAVLRVLNNPQEWMVIPREGRGAAVNVLAPENRNKLRK